PAAAEERATPPEHREPVRGDERVDDRHEQRESCGVHGPAAQVSCHARPHSGGDHGAEQRAEHDRVVEEDRRERECEAERGRCARPRGVQRACPPPIHRYQAHPPTTGSGSRPAGVTASANLLCSAPGSSAMAARRTPASPSPVTSHTGSEPSCAVAATSPLPGGAVRTGRPSWSSRVRLVPSLLKRANTPLADGPRVRDAIAPPSDRSAGHGATTTRSVFGPADPPTTPELVTAPALDSRCCTVLQAEPAGDEHSTRTGKRLPPAPRTNGSGY